MSGAYTKCYDPLGARFGVPTSRGASPRTATPPAASYASAGYGPVASRSRRR
jgi:hypothetical protein